VVTIFGLPRYALFYCTVHCIFLSFFLVSISHSTHITSRQFLTNVNLPIECPSKYRHSKHHLPTSKNRRKVFDLHQWLRRECKMWSLAVKKANLLFPLIKCLLMYLARNNVLAEKWITSYEEEVTYVHSFIQSSEINLSVSSVETSWRRVRGVDT
jgi:hypothetical protein